MMDPKEARDAFTRSLADLRAARDEIRVKIHLGVMDARAAWDKLEPRVAELEHAAVEAAKAMRREVKQIADRLRKD